jgi:aspartyl-tRNA(Asn)/glutamyl-tRNA(Gln) amidotransferase subunit C
VVCEKSYCLTYGNPIPINGVCKGDFFVVKLTGGNSWKSRRYLLQLILIMAKLTREDVLKLARLARLELSDDEVEAYSRELSEILQYVEQLGAVDVSGLKPTNQVTGLTNVYRDDEIKDYGYKAADLLKNVPEVKDGQIKVKRMIG